ANGASGDAAPAASGGAASARVGGALRGDVTPAAGDALGGGGADGAGGAEGGGGAGGGGARLPAGGLGGVGEEAPRGRPADRAHALAGQAIRAGGGVLARRVSADIRKARGDIAGALEDYEAILAEADDPEVRLVLVKLYEHRERAYDRALSLLEAGTTEDE